LHGILHSLHQKVPGSLERRDADGEGDEKDIDPAYRAGKRPAAE